MAIHAPIIAAAACAPGNAPEFAPSRRDLIRALALPALAIVPAAAVASPAADQEVSRTTLNRSRWDALISQRNTARAAVKDFSRRKYGPADAALAQLAGPRPDPSLLKGGYNSAEWHSYKNRTDQAESFIGYDAIVEEFDRLVGLECDAENALFQEPAPDVAAFSTKILIAFADGLELQDHHYAAILRDAERFGGAA